MLKLYNDLRSLIYAHIFSYRETLKLGGFKMVVEVDESLINHDTFELRNDNCPKPKVK